MAEFSGDVEGGELAEDVEATLEGEGRGVFDLDGPDSARSLEAEVGDRIEGVLRALVDEHVGTRDSIDEEFAALEEFVAELVERRVASLEDGLDEIKANQRAILERLDEADEQG